jgi:hypothetical protein
MISRKNIKKQIGGDQNDVINASVDLITSMKDLGKSIFNEIYAITHIESDLNNASSSSLGTPNVLNGPPPFKAPNMDKIHDNSHDKIHNKIHDTIHDKNHKH